MRIKSIDRMVDRIMIRAMASKHLFIGLTPAAGEGKVIIGGGYGAWEGQAGAVGNDKAHCAGFGTINNPDLRRTMGNLAVRAKIMHDTDGQSFNGGVFNNVCHI